jgi:hypothetical protein
VLAAGSAIRSDDFRMRFEEEFRRGLPQRIGVYVSPADVFRQFYSRAAYEELHQSDPTGRTETHTTRTWKGMSDVSEIHPQFDESEALQLIQNRYERSVEMFPYTLRRLSADTTFQQLVLKLRDSGWKDWHILLAVGNVRLNFIVDVRDANYKELMRSQMRKGEGADDPLTPAAVFDEDRLKTALQLSQISTITSMGFRVDQMTPNLPGIDTFLRRFKYWDLDVPHSDPFAYKTSTDSVPKA